MVLIASMLLVMLGGGSGAVARFGCQKAVERWTPLPGWMSIFLVNILGSFLIGIGFGALHGFELVDRANHMTLVQHFQAAQDIQMGLALFVNDYLLNPGLVKKHNGDGDVDIGMLCNSQKLYGHTCKSNFIK